MTNGRRRQRRPSLATKLVSLLQKAAELKQYQLRMREHSLMVERQQVRLEQEQEELQQRRRAREAQPAPRRAAGERPAEAAPGPCYRTALAAPLLRSSEISWRKWRQRFAVWQFSCPPQFPAFRNGVHVQRWLVPADTTFAGGDVLCELRFTPDLRGGNPRWQDWLLQAPQDGYLLGTEHPPSGPVGSKAALGFFIPLTDWQAFVTLLDSQEAAIARVRDEEQHPRRHGRRGAGLGQRRMRCAGRTRADRCGMDRSPLKTRAGEGIREAAPPDGVSLPFLVFRSRSDNGKNKGSL